MTVAFWSSVGMAIYTYLVFPVLMLVRGAVAKRPYHSAEFHPWITVVIAAHDEVAVIGRRIDNLLACDYPENCLEIVVASDGSVDNTTAVARRYADRGVRVLDLPRAGKAAALNAAVEQARGEVLVFTDANTMYAPDALLELVKPLADDSVGGVAGDQRYVDTTDDPGVATGEQQYWNLDRRLKLAQSQAGSVISATGAIYAIRRELYQPIPAGVTDDFYASTAVIDHGYRLVFAPRAWAYEFAAPSTALEFERKVRVITQGLRGVGFRRRLLDPRRTGFYALQLFSHKLLRRVMVLPLLTMAISAPVLRNRGRVYILALVGQATVYSTAAFAEAWSRRVRRVPRVMALPRYFVMVNAACLVAIFNVLRGRTIERWQPDRGDEPERIDIVASRPKR